MNAAFWNLFGDDYAKNCLSWQHHSTPILPPSGDGWQSRWTANPDFLEFEGRHLLYYRGNDVEHDRIGGAEVIKIGPGKLDLKPLNGGQFLFDVGAEGEFDGVDALDPATVVFQGKVWLYYSAIGDGPDSIGLAVSEDGEHFEKKGRIMTGRAPEVVAWKDKLYLTYQLADAAGNYQVYLAESGDGYAFTPVSDEPIFPRSADSWDALSLVTGRISVEGDTFYMIYGGSAYLADEPDYFGVARSTDLVNWEPHPGNPIFGCGPKGAPDGGSMWFPAIYETDDSYVMLFEGSRGKYSWDLSSAICMAWVKKAYEGLKGE